MVEKPRSVSYMTVAIPEELAKRAKYPSEASWEYGNPINWQRLADWFEAEDTKRKLETVRRPKGIPISKS